MASKAEKRRNRRAFSGGTATRDVQVRLVDGRRVVLTGVAYDPGRWGPSKERPPAKRARAWVVDLLLEKGLIGTAEAGAAREIDAVFRMVTGSMDARAANLLSSGGGGAADLPAHLAAIKAWFYDPWCDALSRIQKAGGGPLLGVTLDRVCQRLDQRAVALDHRMRKAMVDSYVIEALRLYAAMRAARRNSAGSAKALDSRNHKDEGCDRSREPRPQHTRAAA